MDIYCFSGQSRSRLSSLISINLSMIELEIWLVQIYINNMNVIITLSFPGSSRAGGIGREIKLLYNYNNNNSI